jgi:hypothetical protein
MRNPRNPPASRTFVTHGYHNATFLTGNATGEIFRTAETRHRLRVQGLLNWVRRVIEVSETGGYKGVSQEEWKELLEANASSPHFDLDSMSDEQFLQLIREDLHEIPR